MITITAISYFDAPDGTIAGICCDIGAVLIGLECLGIGK